MTQEEMNAILNKAAQENAVYSRGDIDKMSGADRLWAGLDYGYGQQRNELQKQYNKAYSETGRQMLSRGMQRSSYGAQTQANVQQQGLEALAKSYQQQASEYAAGLTDIENQEWQKAFQQQQFDWQKESADRQLAASYVQAILAAGGTPSADLLARANISAGDYAAMKPAVAEVGGGGGGYNPTKTNNNGNENGSGDSGLWSYIYGEGNNQKKVTLADVGKATIKKVSSITGTKTTGAKTAQASSTFGQKVDIKKK